jgi:hypothetical protein
MNSSDSRDRDSGADCKVSLKILRYLEQHPNSPDTLEGIVEWWVPKQSIYEEELIVQQALDEMVKQRLLLTTESSSARKHYRLNSDCLDEIRRIIGDADKRGSLKAKKS